jgi:hypothetical protein
MRLCHHCGRELELPAEIQRTDGCPTCFSNLHCCLNCRLFDPAFNNQCREPQAEWCSDKETANFCEFFEFRETSLMSSPGMGGKAAPKRDRARAALDDLFKKTE